jgi:ABC-type sugar transport system ATPase subunit
VTDICATKGPPTSDSPSTSDSKLSHGSDDLVVFRDVSKSFGRHQVLDHISFEIFQGEIVVLCGPSGAGKTTLLRTINGLDSVQEGEVLVDGRSLTEGVRNDV